jgi:hypothetical protein
MMACQMAYLHRLNPGSQFAKRFSIQMKFYSIFFTWEESIFNQDCFQWRLTSTVSFDIAISVMRLTPNRAPIILDISLLIFTTICSGRLNPKHREHAVACAWEASPSAPAQNGPRAQILRPKQKPPEDLRPNLETEPETPAPALERQDQGHPRVQLQDSGLQTRRRAR